MPEIDPKLIELAEEYGLNAIWAIVLLFVGWIAAGWISGFVRKGCDKAKIDVTLGKFFAKSTRWLMLLLVILACLEVFGVETTSFAAVLAAAGFAVGLLASNVSGHVSALSIAIMPSRRHAPVRSTFDCLQLLRCTDGNIQHRAFFCPVFCPAICPAISFAMPAAACAGPRLRLIESSNNLHRSNNGHAGRAGG